MLEVREPKWLQLAPRLPRVPERILPVAPGALSAALNSRSLPPSDPPALQVRGEQGWGGGGRPANARCGILGDWVSGRRFV